MDGKRLLSSGAKLFSGLAAGLDFQFGWSRLPLWLAAAAALLFVPAGTLRFWNAAAGGLRPLCGGDA